jgi:hypothetical protein
MAAPYGDSHGLVTSAPTGDVHGSTRLMAQFGRVLKLARHDSSE